MSRLIKGKRFHIRWQDALSESKWQSAEDILKTSPAIVEATYYYIGKSKAGYCFAGEYNDGEYGNMTIIPSLADIKAIKPAR
jgi:hypothetical protein